MPRRRPGPGGAPGSGARIGRPDPARHRESRSQWCDEPRRVSLGGSAKPCFSRETCCCLHTHRAGLDLFASIVRRLRKNGAPDRTVVADTRLEKYWPDLQLHALIEPRLQYVFVSVVVTKRTGSLLQLPGSVAWLTGSRPNVSTPVWSWTFPPVSRLTLLVGLHVRPSKFFA